VDDEHGRLRVTTSTASTEAPPARLLRLEDVADRLAISRSMAWKLVATGEIRAVRVGRAVRIRPADLEAYIERAAGEG
jgi:excisionase family DNA binding protein